MSNIGSLARRLDVIEEWIRKRDNFARRHVRSVTNTSGGAARQNDVVITGSSGLVSALTAEGVDISGPSGGTAGADEQYVLYGSPIPSTLTNWRAFVDGDGSTVNLATADEIAIDVTDATTLVRGKIRLTNHLGGTASTPTVIGMQETGGPTSLILGAVADGQFLKRVGTTVVGAAGGGGGGEWTDTGTTLHPTETGDEVVLGATTPISSSKFSVDGDADQIQCIIEGNSTQTNDILRLQSSLGGSVHVKVDGSGNVAIQADSKIAVLAADYYYQSGTTPSITESNGVISIFNNSTTDTSVFYYIPIPWQLHGKAVTLRSGTFYYAIVGTGQITSNHLSIMDVSAGTSSYIDNDTTVITSGTSHAFTNDGGGSGFPHTFTADEALASKIIFKGGATGTLTLIGFMFSFDSA